LKPIVLKAAVLPLYREFFSIQIMADLKIGILLSSLEVTEGLDVFPKLGFRVFMDSQAALKYHKKPILAASRWENASGFHAS
jgi:hypothetical protein